MIIIQIDKDCCKNDYSDGSYITGIVMKTCCVSQTKMITAIRKNDDSDILSYRRYHL